MGFLILTILWQHFLFLKRMELKAPISKEAVCTSWPKLVIGNSLFNEYHCTWSILHPVCLNKRLIIMCDVIIITISLSADWFLQAKDFDLLIWSGRKWVGRGGEQGQNSSQPGFSSESVMGKMGNICREHNCKRALSLFLHKCWVWIN